MPLRSVMMKRFILGFQRRVWCPKWTPLSRSWRMVTTAICFFLVAVRARCDIRLARTNLGFQFDAGRPGAAWGPALTPERGSDPAGQGLRTFARVVPAQPGR